MTKIEQTLSSIEVAEMVEKEHKYLMRDIRNYTNIMQGAKISPCDFWSESSYRNNNGQEYPCYRITKKGCEFIAHKMTGTKGTIFTARYINRFHEMQDMITGQAAESNKDKIDGVAKPEISIAQMENLLGFMERHQQFMEHQKEFNRIVIEKLESSKYMSGMKGEIIKTVELVKDDRIVKMIYGFVIGCKRNGNVERKIY